MERKRFYLLIAILSIMLMSLTSCTKDKVVDIEIKEGYEKTVMVGTFDASNYTIVETYKSGKTDEVQVTRDMIPDASYVKTYVIGEQSIEVSYLNTSIYIDIDVTRATLDLKFSDENTFTYDGKPHTVAIEGYYPKQATITYPSGETFVNAGTYTIDAIISCDNYETLTIKSSITITKADYDLSGITFDDATYVYDGEEKTLAVLGDLPDSITVNYTIDGENGNSKENVGTYKVTANFVSTNMNYNELSPITKTLTITKATYSTDEISIGTQNVKYTGELIEWKIKNKLPSWIKVTYHNDYVDEEGKEYGDSSTSYVQKEAGYYTFTISFTVLDSNYEEIPDMTFEVCIYEE